LPPAIPPAKESARPRIVSPLGTDSIPRERVPRPRSIAMIPRPSPALALCFSASVLLLTSCRKPVVREYTAPREATPAPATPTASSPSAPPAPPAPERPKPKIAYTLPAGWEETAPGEVSLAAFTAKGDGGEAAINITPLPDMRGRESLIVNMYRQQTGQEALPQEDLGKTLLPVEVAGAQGQLLELLGTNRGKPIRLITVIAHRDGRSWFYRISGDDTFVTAQKPAFLEFLKSVHITEATVEAPAAPVLTTQAPATPAPVAPEKTRATPAPIPATPAPAPVTPSPAAPSAAPAPAQPAPAPQP
jgi:hypothetical protein